MIRTLLGDRRILFLNIVVILLLGIASFQALPRMEDPVLTERAAILNTTVPGANARRIESLVTEPLMNGLREFDEIKEIRSDTRPNSSTIIITLQDEITNVDEVWARIRDKVSDIRPELPVDAFAPQLEIIRVRAYSAILGLVWRGEQPPVYSLLRRLARELENDIRNLPDTEEVESYGMPDEEILLQVEQSELSKLGMSIDDLSRQVMANDSKQPAGLLRNGSRQMLLEIGEELDSLERIKRIPIQTSSDGHSCYLGDIAKVEKGIRQPPRSEAIVEGSPAIMVAASLSAVARIDYWDVLLNEEIERFRAQLPPQIELVKIFEQRRYVDARINYLLRDLFFSALAVFVVVFLMMGWRSACIVGMALPLASCVVFTLFRLVGVPLHQMSLSGLVIALGMLEGTAIIIIDEIHRRLRQGESNADAIQNGLKHMALPLAGSTGTTILSFLPIAIMPGPSGEFVGTIGLSVIMALCASLVLSFTILPALTAVYFRSNDHRPSFWTEGFSLGWMSWMYRWSLKIFLTFPWLTTLLGFGLAAPGFWLVASMPVQFFPSADRDQLHIDVELSSQANLAETRKVALQISELLSREAGIARVDWVLGRSAPSFYYNMIGTRQDSPNYAEALVLTKNVKDFMGFAERLQEKLNGSIANAQTKVRLLEQGPPFNAPIELRLIGNDEEELRLVGEKLRAIIQRQPGVTQTEADLTDTVPKISYQIDESESRWLNVPIAEMARQLQSSLEGAVGGTILEGNESLPVRVRLTDAFRGDLSEIERVSLRPTMGGEGSQVSLSSLSQATLKSETASITRWNGSKVNEIRGFLKPQVLPSVVLDAIRLELAKPENRLPQGFRIEFGGESSKRTDAVGQLISNVAILVAGTIVVLVLSLRSFRGMFIIVLIGGLSFGMALWCLDLFQYPLGFTAIVGTMGMIGIAINDSIVVLAELRSDEASRRGDLDAIIRLVFQSTRHVLCTTFTVGCSFIPMLIEGGTFWPPMAMVVIGGVFGATVLALYWVPAVFMMSMGIFQLPLRRMLTRSV